MAFDHMWLILFGDEDIINLNYSVRILESLPATVAEFSPAERDALAEIGRQAKSGLFAEPDEYGYTPRDLVSDEQRRFRDAVINKDIYTEDWWSA